MLVARKAAGESWRDAIQRIAGDDAPGAVERFDEIMKPDGDETVEEHDAAWHTLHALGLLEDLPAAEVEAIGEDTDVVTPPEELADDDVDPDADDPDLPEDDDDGDQEPFPSAGAAAPI